MILTLTGASGAGKTTIAEQLIAELPNAHFLTSYTTRAARPSDLPGEYLYLSNDDFDRMDEQGDFLWTAQVADTRHGTAKQSLQRALDDRGAISIMILVPEVLTRLYAFAEELGKRASIRSILIHTPSEDVLRARMRERGDEDEKINARIEATIAYETKARETGINFIEIENEGSIENAVQKITDALLANPLTSSL
jgi:guanylate kinase